MNNLVLGLFGIYLIGATFTGNAKNLVDALREDGPGFVPWLIALGLLLALASNDKTKSFVAPFAILLALNFALGNWGTINQQLTELLKKVQS